jgi:hypothetical protein
VAERIIIPLYGPLGLEYEEHPLIVPHLGVLGVDLTELVPPSAGQPSETTEAEQAVPVPFASPIPPDLEEEDEEEKEEVFSEIGAEEVFWFQHGDLRQAKPRVTALEGARFSSIQHQGLIVVIEASPFLPRATFDFVHEEAARRDITILPIYVRRIR